MTTTEMIATEMTATDRILQKKARIGVVGLGYVGLPLAMLCARKDYRVIGIDCDRGKIESLKRGDHYITGASADELRSLTARQKLSVTDNYEDIPACDAIFICVPTPLRADNRPDYSCLYAAVEAVAAGLRQGQLVVVESTVTPGTTVDGVLPRLASGGYNVGEDFYLAYFPERIDPANKQYPIGNIPKIVSGVTQNCLNLARRLYGQLGVPTVPVSNPAVAEMAKLLENTYRDVNIALVNEMAVVCASCGIDIWEVIEAASTKPFGFQAFYPGPGVGGHCIPKDSFYYIYSAREAGVPARLAEKARRINEGQPAYVVKRLREALAGRGKNMAGSKIFICGVTYKKDVNDIRDSPVIKVMDILLSEGVLVRYNDPYIAEVKAGGLSLTSTPLNKDILAGQDCVVLAIPHSSYDLGRLYDASPFLFDLSNSLAPYNSTGEKAVIL